MNITISVSSDLHLHAAKAGFTSVDAYVQHLIEEDLTGSKHEELKDAAPSDEFAAWKRELDDLLEVLQPGHPHVDDSREAIYSERISELSPHADSP